MIYLDYSATTPVSYEVLDTISKVTKEFIENNNIIIKQLKVVRKIRITDPYRKKGKLVTISQNDWYKINSQLESLYRLRPLKNE